MKILFLTIGDETVASSRVRVCGFVPFLAKEKIEYSILSFTSRSKCRRILELKKESTLQRTYEIFYKAFIISKLFMLSKRYDVIFVQKVILPKMVWKTLRVANKKIVFDFDDAIYLYKDITYLLRDASSVIVSNKDLRGFASKYNARVFELISPVNTDKKIPSEKDDTVTLGWVGSPETSRYLYPLIDVFKELKEKFKNLNIEFMGAKRDKRFESLDAKISDWSIAGEKKHLDSVDIGIMPLTDDEWSRQKAGYKMLLYMSMGTPCVASPVGINSEIITNSVNGYLAETPEEWSKKLSLLIENHALREKLGREALKKAEKFYSYKICAPKMLEILRETVSRG